MTAGETDWFDKTGKANRTLKKSLALDDGQLFYFVLGEEGECLMLFLV